MPRLLLIILIWVPSMSLATPYSIVIHGGAGTILRDKMSAEVESDYRRLLSSAVKAGHAVLARAAPVTTQ